MPLETFAEVTIKLSPREALGWSVDVRANAREALEFARELCDSHYDDPAERERVLAGVGRLVRWADERVR